MKSLFETVINKLPRDEKDILPINDRKIVTCLNPYSIYQGYSVKEIYSEFDIITSDGITPIILFKVFNSNIKTKRFSFDTTSIASFLFPFCEEKGLSIYFLGSKQKEIEQFVKVIKNEYPKLRIKGFHNGYISDKEDLVLNRIIESNPDVIVIGMGAPMQDIIAIKIKNKSFNGSIYTCGGFFHQTINDINYYPNWINKFNLRGFYRIIKEPYVLKRALRYYPKFIFQFSWFLIRKRKYR